PASQDGGKQLLSRLDRALRPAMLLRLEAVHVDGELRRHGQVAEVDEFPSGELGPIGHVEVLGQRIGLPSTDLLQAASPPDAGRSVEVEEAAGPMARGVLDDEVAVQENRLNSGQERIVAIQVLPAGLNHADLGIREVRQALSEDPGVRDEVGVENQQELSG